MNKIFAGLLLCSLPLAVGAQETFDALQMSQTELRGTSRFQSMAGAFGALGGDISTLTQNPGGIGVYRNSDANITLSLDFNGSKTPLYKDNDTRFNVNSVGYVGTIKTHSETMPYFNIGISYNRLMDFHRHYRGGITGNIKNSVTNHIAAYTGNYTEGDLLATNDYNPYYESSAPWSSILSYNSYLMNYNNGAWQGLLGDGTTGNAEYEVDQKGHADEYNVSFGGNVNEFLFWGATVGVTDLDYDSYMYYGESLSKAYIYNHTKDDGTIELGSADLGYTNYLNTSGTGYNFKLGVILKPVSQLRLGFAFHTPTYYDLKDLYKTYASAGFKQADGVLYEVENSTGSGDYFDEVRYDIRTPWRFIGSIAGVIGRQGLISFDYEYVGNSTIRVCDDGGREYIETTGNIKNSLQASHIFRLGGEYRLTPNWSLRAGYSYQSSPVKSEVKDNQMNIATVSVNPAYEFNNDVQYVTCGVGYHYKDFYFDAAYVHKNRSSDYHAFSPMVGYGNYDAGVYQEVKDNDNRVSMTFGFRF